MSLIKWKKLVAITLTITLTGNLGVILPLAKEIDNSRQVIEEVAELPENVKTQKVSLGTEKDDLNLPESLKVKIELTENQFDKAEEEVIEEAVIEENITKVDAMEDDDESTSLFDERKASDSDAEPDSEDNKVFDDIENRNKTEYAEKNIKDSWKTLPVTWSLEKTDNGQSVYDGNVPGIYTFEAELVDKHYDVNDELLPLITVEVEKEIIEDNDEEVIWGEMVELGELEISSLINTYGREDGTVDLVNGNFEKWIDRIDVPDYALDFYKMLEEATDNDGQDDWLIEDKYFSKNNAITVGKLVFNGISWMKISADKEWGSNEWPYMTKCMYAAYAAFRRDHPEVFWINPPLLTWHASIKSVNGQVVYEYTIYIIFKVHEAEDNNLYDVRKEIYQGKNAIKDVIKQRDQAVNTILKSVSSDDIVDQIVGYNDWLTMNNQYCTDLPNAGTLSSECMSALTGSIGVNGPICSGYAQAFKVICDRVGIPCVLVDGFVYNNPNGGHMWNYVKVEDEWYAVDVTWNDPFVPEIGPVSGYESHYWMLLGSNTSVHRSEDNTDHLFIESHPVNNNPGSLSFPNGPELSEERYPIIRPVVEFPETEQKVVYTGKPSQVNAPKVELEDGTLIQNPKISYSYKTSENEKYIDGTPVDVGTYIIRANVATSKEGGYRGTVSSNTLKLVIEKAFRTVAAPTVKEVTDVSVMLNPPVLSAGSDDGVIEYAYNTVNQSPSVGWQEEPLITGLSRNTAYYFFARITNGKNYQDAVSNSGTEGKTDKTKLPKPELKAITYSYTGETVTAEFNGFDKNTMNITGHSATERGNYQAEITLKSEDFTWEDGTSTPLIFDWKIMTGRSLTLLTADNNKITEKHVVLNRVNAVPAESMADGVLQYGYAMEADSSQVKNWQDGTDFAGLESGTTYYFFARITGGTEYIDVTSAALPLTTKKIKLKKPVLSDSGSYIYSGNLIQASVTGFHADEMTISDNVFRNTGSYIVKISLNDTKHYEWEDGTSESVLLNWKITKKVITVKAANKNKYYGEENPTLTLEELNEGVLAVGDKVSDLKVTLTTTADKNSAIGSYPITGKAAEDSNYAVTVQPGTLTISRKSSGGGGGGSHGGGGGGGSRSVGGSSSSGGPGSSLPSYVEKGEWTILNGAWRFVDASGNAKVNTWTAAYNPYATAGQQNYDWFRFDANGNMMTGWFTDVDGNRYFLNPVSDGTLGKMLTGWVWIADEFGIQRCYYFNPNSDGYRGKLLTNTVVDGYTIDANGCWTIDGAVQTK